MRAPFAPFIVPGVRSAVFRTVVRTALCTAAALLLSASPLVDVDVASAQPAGKAGGTPRSAQAPAEPSAEATEQAREAYARGQAAFSAGQYAQAKSAFEEAFAAVPNPVVLLGVAESQAKLGDVPAAIATFTQYLELRADAPDRAEIEGKLQALAATPASVVITSEPAGADIEVDGVAAQQKTPATIELAPGMHEVLVSLPSHHGAVEQVEAKPGSQHQLQIKLGPLSPEPALAQASHANNAAGEIEDVPGLAPVSAQAPVAASQPPTTALWITGGIGAAALVTGTVLGFLALKEHSDFEANPTEASADRGERLALFADVGFGIGAMSLLTAAVLYLTYDDEVDSTDSAEQAASKKRSPSAALQVIPSLTPSSASATARVRF